MTAEEVKDGLRGRHPAFDQIGLGPWTTLEEFANIDLLAFSAWTSKKPPIVGYEVKISRSDYRRELLNPSKRAYAVEGCWQFYMATPKGLLTKEEKGYVEPEHFEDGSAFVRESCPARCYRSKSNWHLEQRISDREISRRRKTGGEEVVPVVMGDEVCILRARHDMEKGTVVIPAGQPSWVVGGQGFRWVVCATCGGRGYLQKSVVEQEAPTLWIPADVGLVEVGDDGKCRTVRKAPVSQPTRELGPIGRLVRWSSFRPDPRHTQNADVEAAA